MSIISQALARAQKTVAYRQLVRHRLDFGSLPIIDKNSYITKNKLSDLIPAKEWPEFVYASSGSTGQASFWFRGQCQEEIGALIHERIIKDNWGINKSEPTLVLVCFSMGIWVAGGYTADSFKLLARHGYKITVATPGIEQADILQLCARVAPLYKNIIIAGYPPFLMDVMTVVKKQTPALLKQKLFFLTAGDKFSENWRGHLLTLIGQTSRQRIINIYGSADVGIMGYETPLTVFLRQKLVTDAKLRQAIFDVDSFVISQPSTLPGLYEYDSNVVHFEKKGDELVVTANTIIPLVRYNTHDLGQVIDGKKMGIILRKNNLLDESRKFGFRNQKNKFVILRGRSDVAVTFYALNIYPENIKAGLEDKRLAKYASGDFRAYVTETKKSERQELHIDVKLKNKVKSWLKIKRLVSRVLTDNLLKVNAEFRKLLSSIGERALPKISFVSPETRQRQTPSHSLVYQRGKKPRLVIGKK